MKLTQLVKLVKLLQLVKLVWPASDSQFPPKFPRDSNGFRRFRNGRPASSAPTAFFLFLPALVVGCKLLVVSQLWVEAGLVVLEQQVLGVLPANLVKVLLVEAEF